MAVPDKRTVDFGDQEFVNNKLSHKRISHSSSFAKIPTKLGRRERRASTQRRFSSRLSKSNMLSRNNSSSTLPQSTFSRNFVPLQLEEVSEEIDMLSESGESTISSDSDDGAIVVPKRNNIALGKHGTALFRLASSSSLLNLPPSSPRPTIPKRNKRLTKDRLDYEYRSNKLLSTEKSAHISTPLTTSNDVIKLIPKMVKELALNGCDYLEIRNTIAKRIAPTLLSDKHRNIIRETMISEKNSFYEGKRSLKNAATSREALLSLIEGSNIPLNTHNIERCTKSTPELPALPKRTHRTHFRHSHINKRNSGASTSRPPVIAPRRGRKKSEVVNEELVEKIGTSIVMSISLTIERDLHHVVAVISERTANLQPLQLQRLKGRDWGEKAHIKSYGTYYHSDDFAEGEKKREDNDFFEKGLKYRQMQHHLEPEWTEVGRSEIIESISGGIKTNFLFSLCTSLKDVKFSNFSNSVNERHIAIYHVPSLGTDFHPVDHFVPVGYIIVDLGLLMRPEYPMPGIVTKESSVQSSESVQHGQCIKKLEVFQHGQFTEKGDINLKKQEKEEQQEHLETFVNTLKDIGMPAVTLPKGKKCTVRISEDKKFLVIYMATSNWTHRKAEKLISLENMSTACMVNNMTPEMKKSLPKKMNLGRKTNGEISRTCFMLLRNQIKKSIVLVHYLLQFKTEQNAIDFVNGIQLLLKTRSLKVMGTIQVNAINTPKCMIDHTTNKFPEVDHVTWTLTGRNVNHNDGNNSEDSGDYNDIDIKSLIIHEELRESHVALKAPILYLSNIIIPELGKKIKNDELELEELVTQKRQIISTPGLDNFAYITDQISTLERELRLGKDILNQIQREVLYMKSTNSKTFRASSAKKEHSGRFMPLNCHSHRIQHNDGSIEAIVTSGAHCAHSLGFKQGGLLTLLGKHREATNTHYEPAQCLSYNLFHRLSVCISQSLAALLTSLMFDAVNNCHNIEYFQLLQSCGYLCHFECLLSTAGDENGMLDDHIVAIRSLKQVRIELYTSYAGGKNKRSKITSMEGSLQGEMIVRIDAGCPLASVSGEGLSIKKPITFKVFPVLISQGINEQQTIANAVGNAGRQIDINRTGVQRLGQYMQMWTEFHHSRGTDQNFNEFETANMLMSKLKDRKKWGKDVELLSICQQFSRLMHGGRMTCCKSGKDRTSMSATLECTFLLSRETEETGLETSHLLSVLRRRGVRRQNLIKNILKPYYAFNQIQWMNLPKMYRPPAGCYGSGVHS